MSLILASECPMLAEMCRDEGALTAWVLRRGCGGALVLPLEEVVCEVAEVGSGLALRIPLDESPECPGDHENEETEHNSGDCEVEPDDGPLKAFHAGDIEVKHLGPNQSEFGGILVFTEQHFVERVVIIGFLPSAQADEEEGAAGFFERSDRDAVHEGGGVIAFL